MRRRDWLTWLVPILRTIFELTVVAVLLALTIALGRVADSMRERNDRAEQSLREHQEELRAIEERRATFEQRLRESEELLHEHQQLMNR